MIFIQDLKAMKKSIQDLNNKSYKFSMDIELDHNGKVMKKISNKTNFNLNRVNNDFLFVIKIRT